MNQMYVQYLRGFSSQSHTNYRCQVQMLVSFATNMSFHSLHKLCEMNVPKRCFEKDLDVGTGVVKLFVI